MKTLDVDFSKNRSASVQIYFRKASFPQNLAEKIAEAKAAIAYEFSRSGGARADMLHLALNEAEALAWETEFPHLVFPALAEEKARAVTAWQVRQQFVRRTAAPITAFAV